MAEEGSRAGAAVVSDNHSALLRDMSTHAGALFELTHDDEDVQFDSEFHVEKKSPQHSYSWL